MKTSISARINVGLGSEEMGIGDSICHDVG